MDVVLDACTLINLINGQIVQKISLIPNCSIFVSDTLLELEILNQSQKVYVDLLLSQKKINLIHFKVTIEEFSALKDRYDLGDGETECIALCKKSQLIMASDDLKARRCAVNELSQGKVIGSLFFIRELVKHGIITCKEAIISFHLMKSKGAYLPKINDDYFCE